MLINISHNNKVLISKEVIFPDNKDALTWMIEAFKEHFNLDISKYSLNKLKQRPNSITIELEKEDLQIWRDWRLNQLGI